MRGELELAGTKRPASFELEAAADGRVHGTLPLTQSEWGIRPYRGMMGALKVRDTIEVSSRRPATVGLSRTCADILR